MKKKARKKLHITYMKPTKSLISHTYTGRVSRRDDTLGGMTSMLISFLADVPRANAWFIFLGATYGWVPKGALMTQVIKGSFMVM